jgi:putative serine protease PepD
MTETVYPPQYPTHDGAAEHNSGTTYGSTTYGSATSGSTTTYGTPTQETPGSENPGYGTPSYGAGSPGWPANESYTTDVPRWPPAAPPAPPGEGPTPTGAGPERHRLRRAAMAAIVAAVIAGGGVAGGVVGSQLNGTTSTASSTATTTAANSSTASTDQLANVVTTVAPSIVTITVQTAQGTAEGSGIILSADGKILTNNHVIESAVSSGSNAISVQLSTGKTVAATIVGRNATADLAVIKAQGVSGLTPATLGSSTNLKVGDTVLAFGSPLGLQGTVTSGIISAVNRSISSQTESLSGLIQTDAAINPGNSGGALVDTAGRIVGVNVAIATTGQNSGNIGVGFAIPINTAKTIANQIIAGS